MDQPAILILGIGNILWADEGFGVRVVQSLQQSYDFPPSITLMDGGTQGLALMPYVQQADILIIIDAVDFQLNPGTLVELHDAEVPAYLGANKMSLHQVSFQEVLVLSQLLGQCPERLVLIGVQPATLEDYGGSLTAVVKSQITAAMDRVLAYLAQLGIHTGLKTPNSDQPKAASGMDEYERLRPSAHAACRIGDSRFL